MDTNSGSFFNQKKKKIFDYPKMHCQSNEQNTNQMTIENFHFFFYFLFDFHIHSEIRIKYIYIRLYRMFFIAIFNQSESNDCILK